MKFDRTAYRLRRQQTPAVLRSVVVAGTLTVALTIAGFARVGPMAPHLAHADCVSVPNLPPICTPSPSPVPTITPSTSCATWIRQELQCAKDAASGVAPCDLPPPRCP